MVSGAAKFAGDHEGMSQVEFDILLTILPCILLVFVINAVYTRSENKRIRAESIWYEKQIESINSDLFEVSNVHNRVSYYVKKMEQDQIRVNYLERFDKNTINSDIERMIDLLFEWIHANHPKAVDLSFHDSQGMFLVKAELKESERMNEDEDLLSEIQRIAKNCGGTSTVDENVLCVMVFGK